MTTKQLTWGKVASILTQIAGVVGIVYGAFTFFHNRENKLENAVTKEEVVVMFKDVKTDISKLDVRFARWIRLSDSVQSVTGGKVDKVTGKVDFLNGQLINHIRLENDLSESQKLDAILQLLNEKKN